MNKEISLTEKEEIGLEAKAEDITEFDKEVDALYALKNEISKKDKDFKERKSILLNKLIAMDKKRYVAKKAQVSVTQKPYFSFPKEPVDRNKFFDYLKERGIFESTISVHATKFNSLCKEIMDEQLLKGELDHGIPGVSEPHMQATLGFRKVK